MRIKGGAVNYTGTKHTKPSTNPGKLGQKFILHKTNPHFLQVFVEINKNHPNEIRQRIFFQSFLYSKRVSHHRLGLAETQKKVQGWAQFLVEKRKAFGSTLIGDCWLGETGGAGQPM